MDLDKGTNQLDKVDGFLTKLGIVLKKHWGKLLLIGIGAAFYWFGKEVLKEYDKAEIDPYYDEEYYDEEYYDEEGYEYPVEQSYE